MKTFKRAKRGQLGTISTAHRTKAKVGRGVTTSASAMAIAKEPAVTVRSVLAFKFPTRRLIFASSSVSGRSTPVMTRMSGKNISERTKRRMDRDIVRRKQACCDKKARARQSVSQVPAKADLPSVSNFIVARKSEASTAISSVQKSRVFAENTKGGNGDDEN